MQPDVVPVQVSPDAKRRRVRLLVAIVLVGTVTAIAYHYVKGAYLELGYPESTFLFRPADRFNDWNNSYRYARHFMADGAAPFIYYPVAFLFLVAAQVLPMAFGLVLLIAAFLATLCAALWRWVADCEESVLARIQWVFILVALSYPVLFAVDRANLDLLLFVLVAGFLYFLYVRPVPSLAVVLLAVAIAFKLFPATLLILLLAERRFKLAGATAAVAIAFTALSVVVLAAAARETPLEIWTMSMSEKGTYQELMVVQGLGVQHGHSLWGMLGLLRLATQATVESWHTGLYLAASGIIAVAVAAYAIFKETERWKRVFYCVVLGLLLPFVSADYALVFVYFPLVFFVNSVRVSRWDTVYIVLFGVLLVPVDYHYFLLSHDGVSTSVVIYPLALVGLLGLALADRRRRPGAGPGRESTLASGECRSSR